MAAMSNDSLMVMLISSIPCWHSLPFIIGLIWWGLHKHAYQGISIEQHLDSEGAFVRGDNEEGTTNRGLNVSYKHTLIRNR